MRRLGPLCPTKLGVNLYQHPAASSRREAPAGGGPAGSSWLLALPSVIPPYQEGTAPPELVLCGRHQIRLVVTKCKM